MAERKANKKGYLLDHRRRRYYVDDVTDGGKYRSRRTRTEGRQACDANIAASGDGVAGDIVLLQQGLRREPSLRLRRRRECTCQTARSRHLEGKCVDECNSGNDCESSVCVKALEPADDLLLFRRVAMRRQPTTAAAFRFGACGPWSVSYAR